VNDQDVGREERVKSQVIYSVSKGARVEERLTAGGHFFNEQSVICRS